MKRFLACLLCLFTLCFLFACDKNPPPSDEGDTQGEISPSTSPDEKSQQEGSGKLYFIPISITEISDGATCSSTITLGSNGLPASITNPYKGISAHDYTYDANGNVTKLVCTYTTGEKTFSEYTYNEVGKAIKCIYTSIGGSKEISDYTYDSNGNLTQYRLTFPSGTYIFFDYIYDANGRKIKDVHRNNNGDNATTDYIYDDKGNLLKSSFFDFYGDLTVTAYAYDAKGNLTNETVTRSYDSDGKTRTDYVYDASGILICKNVEYANGTTVSYDYANEKLIKSVATYTIGATVTYNYSYNTDGNLTRRVYTLSYEDSASSVVVTDEYTYDAYGNVIKFATYDEDGTVTKSIEVQYQPVIVKNGIPNQIQEVLDELLADVYGEQEE